MSCCPGTALDDPDSPELAGIDCNITGDLRLRMSYGLGEALQFKATLLQEVTGEHDGQELILGLEQGVQIGNLPVAFGARVSWKSDDLSNYIYGVSASEAIAGRPAYDTGSTLTPYLSVSTGVPLSRNVLLTGALTAEFFDSDIENSPIVNEDHSTNSFIVFEKVQISHKDRFGWKIPNI